MHKFVRQLVTEWRRLKLPFSGAVFVVAVSGGADSLALALALSDLRRRKKLDLRFVVAHFNHHLRGEESDRDAEFVKAFARRIDFELATGEGRISRRGNLEQNARAARYRFLAQSARAVNAAGILTGHTINDQAETFLLNLMRGSGRQGLSGMSAIRPLEEEGKRTGGEEENWRGPAGEREILPAGRHGVEEAQTDFADSASPILLVRPLLSWARREDTEGFCRDCGVEFRSDPMNEDLAFTRVRIRRTLIPLLETFNPKIINTLARTAELLREESAPPAPVGDYAAQTELGLKELALLPKAVRFEIIREWLKRRRGNLRGLELKHFEAVESLIFSRKSGRVVELPNHQTVVKKNKMLTFRPESLEKEAKKA